MSLFPPHSRGRDQCRLRTAGLTAAQRYLSRLGPEKTGLAFGRTAYSKVPLWIGTETFGSSMFHSGKSSVPRTKAIGRLQPNTKAIRTI